MATNLFNNIRQLMFLKYNKTLIEALYIIEGVW